MSGIMPPIPPPPFRTSSSNPSSPNVNRVDMMPTTNDPINITNTTNVSQNVVDENLPQLLDSRGGSHVINVPAFDAEDFTSWKVRFMVFLDGFKPYLLKTLKDGPFVPMSSLSTSENPLPKRQNQWSNAKSRLANQDKRLKSIIISCLPNNVMKSVIKCKTAKEIWNDLILAHEGPSDTRDTKIAALRLKFNAFKSLEGEKRMSFRGKADARSGQWVDITMKKEPHPPLPKLIGATPTGTPESLISLSDLTLNMADLTLDSSSSVPKKTRPTSVKVSYTYIINKKTEKVPDVPKACFEKKAYSSTEQLLLTLIEEDYLKRFVWYLDSGCFRHMTWIKQYLHRYSKESGSKVVFGDDSSGDTEGYDSVNCNGITFTRVAYVNGLKHNLISISQLCDANYKVLFTKTQGTIFNQNNEVVLIAPRRKDVYVN
ncbi:hypothetical protein Tco_0066274 [Tanacetum coccineum]